MTEVFLLNENVLQGQNEAGLPGLERTRPGIVLQLANVVALEQLLLAGCTTSPRMTGCTRQGWLDLFLGCTH